MINTTKTIGYLLMLLGGISYFVTNMVSPTALIPAFFGIAFLGIGLLAEKRASMRKHAIHVAILLAVAGFAGSVGGIFDIIGSLGDRPLERPQAAIAQCLMALICIIYVYLSIRSFITARRKPSL